MDEISYLRMEVRALAKAVERLQGTADLTLAALTGEADEAPPVAAAPDAPAPEPAPAPAAPEPVPPAVDPAVVAAAVAGTDEAPSGIVAVPPAVEPAANPDQPAVAAGTVATPATGA